MNIKHWFATILGTCLIASAFASGSYNARPPRVPAGQTAERGGKIDKQKYALGKQIYTGKAKLTAQPTAERAAQETRLRALQARLPAKVQADVNLPGLAGKLSTPELEALEYYVAQRHPAKSN
jgi:hypothetical protein